MQENGSEWRSANRHRPLQARTVPHGDMLPPPTTRQQTTGRLVQMDLPVAHGSGSGHVTGDVSLAFPLSKRPGGGAIKRCTACGRAPGGCAQRPHATMQVEHGRRGGAGHGAMPPYSAGGRTKKNKTALH